MRLSAARLALALLGAAIAACGDASGIGEPSPSIEPGRLTARDCAGPATANADCFWLEVPESRHGISTRTIRIPVMVLRSSAEHPAADPLLVPQGGPGYAGLELAPFYAASSFRAQRDIVLLDQRGTGIAEPSLDCPERERSFERSLAAPGDFAIELEDARESLRACRARLVAEGVVLDAYDTEENAADLIALRLALGVDRWSILAVSYATRLALELMRRDPGGIRAAILDSVYPPGAGGVEHVASRSRRALDALLDGCAADPRCAGRHPDLRGDLERALERFDRNPVEDAIELADGRSVSIALTGSDIFAGLVLALYDTSFIPILPDVIADLAAGRTAIAAEIARQGIPFVNDVFEGMSQSVDCADNAGLTGDAGRALLGAPGRFATVLAASPDPYCEVWNVPPTRDDFQDPVTADVPALVLAGSYDPATPPADSRSAAAALPRSTYVELAGAGHGVFGISECSRGIVRRFLADPDAPVDASCAAEMTGPPFPG